MSIETEITRIKTNISNAYLKAEEKGATLPEVQNSSNLPATIESITGGGEWQPEPDWWDIDKILEEDTEDYPGKMILLLSAYDDSTTLELNNADKLVTSDGVTYTTKTTHTWDKLQDKQCSLGYSTRYVIWYFSKDFNTYNPKLPNNVIYAISNNINFTSNNSFTTICFGNFIMSEAIKYQDCSFNVNAMDLGKACGQCLLDNVFFINCQFNTKKYVLGVNYYSSTKAINKIFDLLPKDYLISTGRYTIASVRNVIEIPRYVLAEGADGYCNRNFFQCYRLKKIGILDLNYATTLLADNFQQCYSLEEISEVYNIKLSGLSFKDCTLLNHDTLIRILNALYDYSAGDTHTITLGSTNLAKLTEEELAIGTNKNWTIS